MKYWEIIADNLSKAGWSWGCVSAIDSSERTIWIADAHQGDEKRCLKKERERSIRPRSPYEELPPPGGKPLARYLSSSICAARQPSRAKRNRAGKESSPRSGTPAPAGLTLTSSKKKKAVRLLEFELQHGVCGRRSDVKHVLRVGPRRGIGQASKGRATPRDGKEIRHCHLSSPTRSRERMTRPRLSRGSG